MITNMCLDYEIFQGGILEEIVNQLLEGDEQKAEVKSILKRGEELYVTIKRRNEEKEYIRTSETYLKKANEEETKQIIRASSHKLTERVKYNGIELEELKRTKTKLGSLIRGISTNGNMVSIEVFYCATPYDLKTPVRILRRIRGEYKTTYYLPTEKIIYKLV